MWHESFVLHLILEWSVCSMCVALPFGQQAFELVIECAKVRGRPEEMFPRACTRPFPLSTEGSPTVDGLPPSHVVS